jgi:hypothetical protein
MKLFVDGKDFTNGSYICCDGKNLLHEIQKSDIEYNPHTPQHRMGYTWERGVGGWLKKKKKGKNK